MYGKHGLASCILQVNKKSTRFFKQLAKSLQKPSSGSPCVNRIWSFPVASTLSQSTISGKKKNQLIAQMLCSFSVIFQDVKVIDSKWGMESDSLWPKVYRSSFHYSKGQGIGINQWFFSLIWNNVNWNSLLLYKHAFQVATSEINWFIIFFKDKTLN